MPDTKAWRMLTAEDRGTRPPISTGTLDQIDATMGECADRLGFDLTDHATIEGAILGLALARFIQHHAYKHEGDTKPGPGFEREMVIAMGLARWLLVERLNRMEGTDG